MTGRRRPGRHPATNGTSTGATVARPAEPNPAALRPMLSRSDLHIALLVTTMLAVGTALHLGYVRTASWSPMRSLPWLVVAALFAVGERAEVNIELGNNAVALTLSHVVLVLGLFVLAPNQLIVARVVGGVVALTPYLRARRQKLAFNAALYYLEVVVVVAVFRVAGGTPSSPGMPWSWGAAFVAVVACSLTSLLFVYAAMRATDASHRLELRWFLSLALLGELANSSLGLAAAGLLATSWYAPLLLVVPSGVLYVSYRAYARLVDRHRRLERLYQLTGELSRTPEQLGAINTIVGEAMTGLRAQSADLLLLGAGAGGTDLWVRLDDGKLVPLDGAWRDDLGLAWVVTSGRPTRTERARGRVDAVIAPVIVNGVVVGALSARGRMGNVTAFGAEDVTVLSTLANQAAVSLENSRLVEELRTQAAARERLASYDTLTGLVNRRQFTQLLGRSMGQSDPVPGAVVLIDLNGFRDVNETLGHAAGDRLLRAIADRLRGLTAASVALSRVGGDEFAVLLQPATADEAVTFANAARAAIAEPVVINGLHLCVGSSIGIACFPDHARDETSLMQKADAAVFTAKEHRVEPIQVYAQQPDRSTGRRLQLAADLREAIENEDLIVYFQPQIELATGALHGVEALLRWKHPVLGWIRPDEFIAVGENVGLISKITDYVLSRAIAQASAWCADGMPLELAINLSALNLMERNLPNRVGELLVHHGLPSALLTLEITETEIMSDPERMIEVLDRLDALGVRLSIDDFGTGYSSLAYLRRLPVTEVKIDKSFVFNLGTNVNDQAIVRTIIDLASNLQMRVVAEGIEEPEAIDRLVAMGCELGQGFHVAAPMPGTDVRAWAQRYRPLAPANRSLN